MQIYCICKTIASRVALFRFLRCRFTGGDVQSMKQSEGHSAVFLYFYVAASFDFCISPLRRRLISLIIRTVSFPFIWKTMNQPESREARAKEKIRSAGMRVTPARVATLDILLGSDSPLTHGDVYSALRGMNIDKATVFRNLNDLVTANVLRRSELGDHVWRFEVIDDSEHEHRSHPHFVCVDCGSVSCMEKVELSKKSQSLSLAFGKITEILLRGHCKNCI